jgi:hypothetical protein
MSPAMIATVAKTHLVTGLRYNTDTPHLFREGPPLKPLLPA